MLEVFDQWFDSYILFNNQLGYNEIILQLHVIQAVSTKAAKFTCESWVSVMYDKYWGTKILNYILKKKNATFFTIIRSSPMKYEIIKCI